MDQFSPTTESELLQALAMLICRAHENGVTVTDRGMEIRNQNMPDCELMVYELTPKIEPESESTDSRYA